MKSQITNRKSKTRVGVLFGGRSAEHEVSLVSATSVIKALDKEKYEIIPIGITPEGKWLSSSDTLRLLKERTNLDSIPDKILLPDPNKRGLMELHLEPQTPNLSTSRVIDNPLDVIFPVLHGTFGEDGTVQGLLELAGIPYVGAGVLGSAVGMDKVITKQLCERVNVPVSPYVWFLTNEYGVKEKKIISAIEQKLKYPCFVKPANLGSSVGITKTHNRKELVKGIELAAEYDRKILVEKSIEHAREIEVSVLGNDDPIASVPGEIIPSNEFYDYDAKYVDGKSTAIVPAKLPDRTARMVQKYAVEGFKAIDCAGMARVDFLVTKRTNKIFFNEINTIPGFTSISMYPKLWEASGIPYPELLDRLINLAIERFNEKRKLKTAFKPKTDWYKQ
ncbi:MAG: D-alanine--D-alanine ligase [Ignavibacteriae bacterium]|nr:D-alanine--D-alanine ligase [Ignavibacteriota bacterium]